MTRYACLRILMAGVLFGLTAACSGNDPTPTRPTPVTPPAPQPISQQQVETVILRVERQVSEAIANAFSRITFNDVDSGAIARPLLTNVQISGRAACSGGGSVGVSGSMTGNDPAGSTFTLLLQITATLTDCREGDLVINGDPSLSTSGSFRVTGGNFSADLRSGGGFRFTGAVTGSCQQNITTGFNAAGGRSSGTVDCRGNGWATVRNVNIQF
ncbi:MAG: hypothetical protein HY657_08065 [Acidobacteria bacterium]|nr:hypothetical protein [Acidobacteriota bacterium]